MTNREWEKIEKEFDEKFCNFWHPTILKKYPDLVKLLKSFLYRKLGEREKEILEEVIRMLKEIEMRKKKQIGG